MYKHLSSGLPFLCLAAGCLADPVAPCATDAECADAFGFGQVCGEAGYCEAIAFPDRCISSEPPDLLTDPGKYDKDMILVGLYDHSYDFAEQRAARLAIKQANDGGGIDGQQLGFLECTYEENAAYDDLDYPGAIAELGEFLAGRMGLQGFVGPYTSGQSEAWYNATADLDPKPFMISGAATSPALTYIDGVTHSDADPGTVWRTVPPDSLQGKVAADDMIARGRTNVAVVYQSGAYGEGLWQIFSENFSGGDRVVQGLQFSDSGQLAEHVATINNQPDVQEVFVISGEATDVADFLDGAATLGGYSSDPTDPYPATGKGIFLADASADTDMLADANEAASILDCKPTNAASGCTEYQIRGTRPAIPNNTLYDTFRVAYQSEYDDDPNATVYMPFAYDSAWLAVYATAWARYQEGAVTGKGMGAGMRQVSAGVEVDLLPTGWATARAAFEDGAAINVTGTSGPLDYDPATEECATAIEVWVVNATNDNFDVVDLIEPE